MSSPIPNPNPNLLPIPPAPPVPQSTWKTKLLEKILFVVSVILILAPCGFAMMAGGFPYAVTSIVVGSIFFIFSTYLLCKKS